MDLKAFLRMIVLFLGFYSLLISCVAVPSTRSLKTNIENPSSIQVLLGQDNMDLSDNKGVFGMGESYTEGRMDMENTVDYPGTGANNHHEPKTPGRV